MASEVLLMAEIKGLGGEGDVVRVAEGYARNFLFPKKLAAPVNEGMRRRLAKQVQEREATRERDVAAARSLAGKLSSLSVKIAVKAGADQKLYGSVSAADIAAALKDMGIEVDKVNVLLETPIKALGIYSVPVKLHAELEAPLKVLVVEG